MVSVLVHSHRSCPQVAERIQLCLVSEYNPRSIAIQVAHSAYAVTARDCLFHGILEEIGNDLDSLYS